MGIFKNDGGVVIDPRIDLRLVVIDDGGHGDGRFAVHEPGHQVDAVAAEVIKGAGAVLSGIGKPLEEVGADTDFFGAVVAIVDNNATHFAEAIFVNLVIGGLVA